MRRPLARPTRWIGVLLTAASLLIASAAAAQDTDADGIPDAEDNCLSAPNGPSDGAPAQRDTDLDGYGNRCDADFNNDGFVAYADYVRLVTKFGSRLGDASYHPEVDMDGDGAIGNPDFSLFRRYLYQAPGPSGLACAGASPCPAQNVLILIADDVGLDNVGAYDADVDPGDLSTPPSTPQLDSLAAGGVRFRNVWGNPVCSPTRATLLTGLYGFRTGIGSAIPVSNPDVFRLDPAWPSLAREFGLAGYRTAAFGKWHLSDSCGRLTLTGCDPEHYDLFLPLEMGFESFDGTLANVSDYCAWPKLRVERNPDGTLSVLENAISHTYATTDTVSAVVTRLATLSEPWFAWVAFNSAHPPLHDARAADPCPMASNGLDEASQYDTMVERMDQGIASVLASLPAPVLSRTTVVFVGDNGTYRRGVEAPFDPLRAKGSVHQGGVNVPFIVASRASTVPLGGATSPALVNTTDVFATLAAQAGRTPPAGLDSVSFLAQLGNAGLATGRSSAYAEKFQPNGAGPHATDDRAIRDARHKLIRSATRGFEAYDLVADPQESSDLIREIAELDPSQREALVSLAASMASLQGETWSLYDFDGDGVANDADDCSLLPNPSQSDCDGDLRGDSCDGDVTGDGLADRFDSDALAERVGAGGVPYAPSFDMNCDARIDAADLGLWSHAHGPTGCGGAIPCTPP